MNLPRAAVRILCAVVTYNEDFERTRAARSLAALPQAWRSRIDICCVANEGSHRAAEYETPQRVASTLAGMSVLLLRTGSNGGLALGYNLALGELDTSSCEYVLFLNSDSEVQAALLEGFQHALQAGAAATPRALAPHLVSGSLQVSPFRKAGFAFRFFIIGFMFCHCSLFPRSFRFPAAYWLDGIDYWFSRYLSDLGVTVAEIPITVPHQLSVADGFASLPGWRYRNIVASELRFQRECRAPAWVRARLVVRGIARCLRKSRPDLLPEIWQALRLERAEARKQTAR